ncbi:MAG TPA: VWA domain-containing protein, partial [Pyrinomonadaceae bacterium]|nr:VWA domain-containing protein [Pyrinomonadaceae bacterium]
MKRSLLPAFGLMLSLLAPAVSQQPADSPQQRQGAPDEDEVVKISTNLVQIDAVVTGGDGRQVTDLEASDFEILEDGRPQQITNFSYVSLAGPAPAAPPAPPTRKERNYIPPPPAALRPEQVRRTIALVVDDLGLSFESTVYVRQALRKFIDERLQPNDLAAVILTSAGSGSLQQFTADKRRLYAAVERVRWYPVGRGGLNALKSIDLDPLDRVKIQAEGTLGSGGGDLGADTSGSNSDVEAFREDTLSIGTLGAIKYVVQGMRELPGRKSVLLLSDGLKVFNPAKRGENSNGRTTAGRQARDRDVNGMAESLRRLTDLANRASVVIYALDARGLQTLGFNANDDALYLTDAQVRSRLAGRGDEFIAAQDGLNYLARQTGGFFIHDANDLARGIGKIYDDQRGFYLIGYRPDESTFDRATGARRWNRLAVRVKRPGLTVRTRTGFYGVTDAELRPAPRADGQQLRVALESPFSVADLPLRLTSLFFEEPGGGAFMRNLIHIDGHGLTFADEPNGWHKVSFELLAVTFGAGGEAADTYGRAETMRVSEVAYRQARAHGLIYTLDMPVQKAGAYQLRIAVRDAASGRVGSASQFVEVPDLGKNRLALSGVAVTGYAPKQGGTGAADSAVASDEPDPQSGPAVRRMRPGMTLQYAYLIYNAKTDQRTHTQRLLTQVRLYREGELLYAGRVTPYAVGEQKDLRRLP